MSTVIEVMAKLSGNSSGMVAAFKQAVTAADNYKTQIAGAAKAVALPDITGPLRDERGKFVSTAAQMGDEAGAKLGKTYTQAAGSHMSIGFGTVAKIASAGLAAISFAGFIRDAATASDATDKFVATMNFAGLDTSAIEQARKATKAYADATVYDLPTIQNTTAQLASNGIKDYTGLTQAAGNLNAVAGGSAETFKSVAMMMTQTAGAGKLSTENWNQLADAIPGASGPLQKALKDAGAYTGNFREAMEKGEITADEFNAAIMKLGNQPVAVEAARSTKTFEGALGSLQATINSGLMSALNAIKPAATGAITALSNGLGKAFQWVGDAATGLYDLFAKGDFSAALNKAFHLEEDSGVVDFLFKVRDGAMQLWSGLSMGSDVRREFAGKLEGIIAFGAGVRATFDEVIGSFRAFVAAFKAGDGDITSDGMAGAFEAIGGKAREVVDTLTGAFKKIGEQAGPGLQAVAPAFRQLGDAFLSVMPSVLTLMQALSPVGIALAALTPVLPVLAGAAAQLAAALGTALAGAVNAIAPVIAGVITSVADGVTWFMSLHGAAESLAAGITALVAGFAIYNGVMTTIRVATAAWAAVQGVLNAVMAVNPVTLIIIGIAALIAAIVLLVMNWDTVVGFITQVWGGFVNWVKEITDGFASWLGDIWASIVAGITAFASAIFAPIQAGFTAVADFITGVWNSIASGVGAAWAAVSGAVSAAVTAVVTPIVEGFTTAMNFISGIFTGVGNVIIGAWTWVWNLLLDIGRTFWAENGAAITAGWNVVVGIFNGAVGFVTGVWNTITGAISTAVNWVVTVISTGFTTAYNWVVSVLTTVWSFIVSIWTQVSGFIGGIMSAIGAGIAAAWNWYVGIITGVLSAIWGVISSVFNAVWGFISSIWNTVAGFISGVWNGIIGTIRGAVQTVWNAVSSKFNEVWSTVSSIFNSVSSSVSNIWNGIVNAISGAIGNVATAVGGVKDKVVGAVSGAASWLWDAGANIVQGLINGIGSLAGTIGNAFLSMVPGWIVEPFKRALGIASPSKLFKRFGRWIIEGLGIGVKQEEGTAVGAMSRAADAVAAAGSGITIAAPTIGIPTIPSLAEAPALPVLTQLVRLQYVGSPLEALKALSDAVALQGPDAALRAMDTGAGYNGAAITGWAGTGAQEAPQVTVNVTARVVNPFTQEEVEVFVKDASAEVTAGALSGTARVVRNSRTGGQGGF